MIKAKLYQGQPLKGLWDVTLKIDGVRALFSEGQVLSRRGKPLYNIPTDHGLTDCEVFLGSFKETISATRTHDGTMIPMECLYSLDPVDPRLVLATQVALDPSKVDELFKAVSACGHEGLILRQGDKWLKVKAEETFDVLVTGRIEGTGRNVGRLGALMTTKGKVGTGFTDADREALWTDEIVGQVIEVSCMELTEDGKFRHPRFVRVRPDKDGTMVD